MHERLVDRTCDSSELARSRHSRARHIARADHRRPARYRPLPRRCTADPFHVQLRSRHQPRVHAVPLSGGRVWGIHHGRVDLDTRHRGRRLYSAGRLRDEPTRRSWPGTRRVAHGIIDRGAFQRDGARHPRTVSGRGRSELRAAGVLLPRHVRARDRV